MAGLGNVYKDAKYKVYLPHFTQSAQSVNLDEPIYQSMFVALLTLPPSIQNEDTKKHLTAQLKSISGLTIDPASDVVEQSYRGAKRSFAGGLPSATTLDLSLNFNMNLNKYNQMETYKLLQAWNRLIHDPLTGIKGKKKDYVGAIEINGHDRAGDIYMRIKCPVVFLSGGLPEFSFDSDANDIINLDGITFRADYWTYEFY